MTTVVSAVAIGMGAALAVALVATRARLRRIEDRTRCLEERLAAAEPAIADVRAEAAAAGRVARRAADATGVGEPPPRIVLEPLTGPVVRAVALGAGARRAITRLAGSRRGPARAPGPTS